MAEPFLGEIIFFTGQYAPIGYLQCAGQLLPIGQNETLFGLLGTAYGGNASQFALPDMRGRVAVGQSDGLIDPYVIGQTGGSETVKLIADQLPAHSHAVAVAGGDQGNTVTPGFSTILASESLSVPNHAFAYAPYNAASQASLSSNSVSPLYGAGFAHPNVQPVLALTCCISVNGTPPPRG